MKHKYNSLEDFLTSHPLTVDGELNDGWGVTHSVKGREIEATVLFCDISEFSLRTMNMSSTETLIFVNRFFCWITAEALRLGNGIVDKYIGDEVMIVFAKEFGSEDPFADALLAGRRMCENDALDFRPHIGIASGPVTVGYVGTPVKYNCSVFGAAVALAARCAGVKVPSTKKRLYSTAIVFPAADWGERSFDELYPPQRYRMPDGTVQDQPHAFELLEPWKAPMKNLPDTDVRAIVLTTVRFLNFSVEDQTKRSLESLRRHGSYRPGRKSKDEPTDRK
jgi:class 3 adenylate cyclase